MGMYSAQKPAQTEQESALAELGANQFNDYIERYVPQEDQLRERIKATPDKIRRAQGEASAQAAFANRGAVQEAVGKAAQTGGGIGSGLSAALGSAPTAGRAQAAGVGVGTAISTLKDRELTGRLKLTAFGRGLSDQSRIGLTSSARNATQAAIDKAKYDQQQDYNLLSGGMAAAGMGMNRILKDKKKGTGLFGPEDWTDQWEDSD